MMRYENSLMGLWGLQGWWKAPSLGRRRHAVQASRRALMRVSFTYSASRAQ